MAASVTVDTAQLQRDTRRLVDGIRSGADTGARRQANETASRVSRNVPRRTGRLASTVGVVGEAGGGYGVTYGGDLPYANYIEHRSGAVAAGVEGAELTFTSAMAAVAAREVGRL